MANEVAVIVELLGNAGDPLTVVVDNTIAVPKGTLMKITDNRVAAATAADNDPFIGIAAAEKVANDGSTCLAVYTHCVARLYASAAIAVGEVVSISGANAITKTAEADRIFSNVGVALEAIGAAGQLEILVRTGC